MVSGKAEEIEMEIIIHQKRYQKGLHSIAFHFGFALNLMDFKRKRERKGEREER